MEAAIELTLVCHQIRSPDNLGAIARVAANFQVKRLILSDPATHDFRGAEKLAIGAEHVLRDMAVAPSLPEALAGAVYAVGTTSRTELKRRVALTPEEGVAALRAHAARGPVALVLGGEKRGLSDDELSRCQDVIVIPTSEAQPSMNVAQSAAVLLYLWHRAQAPAPAAPVEGAPLAMVQALEARMEKVLLAVQGLNAQAPEHVLRELSRTLVRAGLTKREAELWLSVFGRLGRVTSGEPPAG